jgi:hypothetical protein
MTEPPAVQTTPTPRKSPALAVWSLVLGILSLTCFWLLAAIPAVICGHMAYGRIRRSAGALSGQGLALAGIITGYLSIAISIALSIFVLPLLLAIAIPNFVKARETAQTNACISNLRQLDGAKQQWALEKQKTDTATPTAQDLEPYLKGTLICPAGGAYTLHTVGEKPTCSIPNHELP